MNLIAHITAFAAHRIELIGRERARNALLTLSDRNLADAGFSRELLNKGVKAWPWKVEAETDATWGSQPASTRYPAASAQKTMATRPVQGGLTA